MQGIFNDTIILYMSDNGGPTKYGSINWPMRGGKASFWEGGMRSWTVFSYPRSLATVNATWSSLVHVTDWYTTFLRAAGGQHAVPCFFLCCAFTVVDKGRHRKDIFKLVETTEMVL